jgi:hypothetical protein
LCIRSGLIILTAYQRSILLCFLNFNSVDFERANIHFLNNRRYRLFSGLVIKANTTIFSGTTALTTVDTLAGIIGPRAWGTGVEVELEAPDSEGDCEVNLGLAI